ncbi:MAG: DNA polymerase III subunit delta, partial [Serpentinimonas sp.]|nr:DNA polymerase III subunit delta [Serpentinimonas sp.]
MTAQLTAQLQRGLKPLYTVHGDEALLVQEAADAIRAAARAQGFLERSVFVASGAHFDWSAVRAAALSQSLFAERQLLELRLPSGKPGKDGAAALQQLAEAAPANPDLLTLVLLPRLDATTLKSPWFAALAQHGPALRIDAVERAQLPVWIAQRLQLQGQRVPSGAEGQRSLDFLADRVEGNLLAAHQEIQKLALLYPAGELGFEQIERAVLDVAR